MIIQIPIRQMNKKCQKQIHFMWIDGIEQKIYKSQNKKTALNSTIRITYVLNVIANLFFTLYSHAIQSHFKIVLPLSTH